MRLVSCVGASLTEGTVSANYVDMLAERQALGEFDFRNHGVNGELAVNVLQRLDDVIAEHPEFVTILVGTNDANSTLSDRNFAYYREVHGISERPTAESYEQALRDIVTRLQDKTNARVALISLAPIGEDPEFEGFRRIAQYNEIMRRVAESSGVDYLPAYEKMVDYLREHEYDRAAMPPRLAYREGLHNIGTATALHAAGMSWNDVARRHGLLLLTDTIHLNETGAGIIADLIEGWLLG
jgi:lysophospholipase L1-like esterase